MARAIGLSPSLSYLAARNVQKRTARGEGAGAISQVAFKGAGFYESTGTDVAVRSKPMVSTPWGENVLGTLNTGDVVKASGLVQSSGGIEFAEVSSVFDVQGKPSWVATMYLQPSSKTKISGGGGAGPDLGGGGGGGGELAEKSIFGGGIGIAFGLLLVAVAIYFIAK